jgi:hypothetical protein
MIVEKVFHNQDIPQEQRRLQRHEKRIDAARGTKKSSTRRRVMATSSDDDASEEDDDEDDIRGGGGRPPVPAIHVTPMRFAADIHKSC